jgi:hypothetical protein
LTIVQKNNIPKREDLDNMTVWNILENLPITPVFLERWAEKNHIRNAIGHARVTYDSASKQVRFIDVDKQGAVSYDSGNIPFSGFAEMALELEDSLTAFLHFFLLLRIHGLITSTNPY